MPSAALHLASPHQGDTVKSSEAVDPPMNGWLSDASIGFNARTHSRSGSDVKRAQDLDRHVSANSCPRAMTSPMRPRRAMTHAVARSAADQRVVFSVINWRRPQPPDLQKPRDLAPPAVTPPHAADRRRRRTRRAQTRALCHRRAWRRDTGSRPASIMSTQLAVTRFRHLPTPSLF